MKINTNISKETIENNENKNSPKSGKSPKIPMNINIRKYSSDAQKKRVGILGGSFNPPTIGHMQIAVEALNLGHVDEVWLVPCGFREDKYLVDDEHRLAMTNLIVDDFFKKNFSVKVNDIEIKQRKLIPTYHLMKYFIKTYPELMFFFIIGSDLLKDLEKWENGINLKKEINFIVFWRTGYHLNQEWLPNNYILVRKRIKQGFIHQTKEYDGREKTSFGEKKFDIPNYSDPEIVKRVLPDKSIELQEKYLGVFGIIPKIIIDYIKKNNLFA